MGDREVESPRSKIAEFSVLLRSKKLDLGTTSKSSAWSFLTFVGNADGEKSRGGARERGGECSEYEGSFAVAGLGSPEVGEFGGNARARARTIRSLAFVTRSFCFQCGIL